MKDIKTCETCNHYMGGGDFGTCCSQHHNLCYEHTKACDKYDDSDDINDGMKAFLSGMKRFQGIQAVLH